MTVRIGINGLGRIGRSLYRVLEAQKVEGECADPEVVAVNDLTDNAALAHLLKFDSILGRLPQDVSLEGDDTIVLGSNKIKAIEIKEGPAATPCGDVGVDVVIESTGRYTEASNDPRDDGGPLGRDGHLGVRAYNVELDRAPQVVLLAPAITVRCSSWSTASSRSACPLPAPKASMVTIRSYTSRLNAAIV